MSENHTHNHSSVLSVQVLVFLGLMGALSIVLSFVGTIRIGNYLRIGFSDLPNRLNDFLLGPFLGALFGGVMDIVKYLLQPTGPFFPGYTLSAVCGSLIFGFITHGMHGHKLSLVRIFAAELLIKVFVNIGMNTAWSCLLYGNALMAILPATDPAPHGHRRHLLCPALPGKVQGPLPDAALAPACRKKRLRKETDGCSTEEGRNPDRIV